MTFEYANAGHPCPLHVHEGHAEHLESHGMLTGVLPESEYRSSKVHLTAGDLLVFFSDGITEAVGRQNQLVRSAGVAEAVLTGPRDTADDVVRAVMSALEPGGTNVSDDRTLLVIRLP
jgi:sigma-B regulation protein RsbU (phosphoserine phosphatase)